MLVLEGAHERGAEIMAKLLTGASWTGEFVMQCRDGTTVPVSVTDSPVRDSNGKLAGIIGVSIDITDRKRAEQALRASEDRFRQIIETAQEGVWTVDASGVTTFVNQRLTDLLGYTAAQMVGRPLDDFLDDEGRAFMAANIDTREHGRSERLDVKFVCADGKPFWAQVASWIRHHHERWDGRGYPDGLAGDAIPFASRIIALADGYLRS